MQTSITSPLGSPSFIEQQWKPLGKENSAASAKRKFVERVPSMLRENHADPHTPKKAPESSNRVPSFIAKLSPQKPKFHSPKKKICPSSPVKPSLSPQAAAWNTFIPLHYCPQPFELPRDQIQTMIASIKSANKLPPFLAQGAMLAKIVELAHTAMPNLVHYKKQTPLFHPASASPPNKGLAGSFFAASLADRIYVMVPNRQVIARGSQGKVTEATGLVFKKNGSKIEFEAIFDAIKHTVALKESGNSSLDSVLKRVKSRIQAATDLSGVPHVANPFFHGVLLSQRGSKMVMMYPRYGGDLFDYHSQHVLTDEQRQCNTLKIAEHLSTALQGIHAGNYVHRDVKEENLLVNWGSSDKLLETVDLADFDLSTNAMDNTLCGTLAYLAPEMMAMAFKSEAIAQALGVQNLSSLYGPSIDTWGLGIILHRSFYGRMPEHVNLLFEYLAWNKEIEEAEHALPEHLESLRRLADEVKEKWIKSMLEAIEKEKVQQPSEEITWDNFIQSLLLIDPRKRPNDAAIQQAIASLKSLKR